MMYSDKCKSIIKYSLCSLTAAIFISSTFLVNIDTAQAQLLRDHMSCIVTSASDIKFDDINLVNPGSGAQGVLFKPSCTSDYYRVEPATGGFPGFNYTPIGSVCLGISSIDANESLTKRFLYLNGDTASTFKLPFNFFFSIPGATLPIGNGINETGIISRGEGEVLAQQPATGQRSDVPIHVNMTARFDFTNTGLPVGIYRNTYNFTLWTGVSTDNTNPTNGICSGNFPNASAPQQINVEVKVLPSCKFEILDHVNFGQHMELTSNMTATGKLGVTCNSNASYEIQLDGGRSKDVNNRTMSLMNGTVYDDSEKISYNLYLPNSGAIWGNTKGTNTYTATASDHLQQSIEVKAMINPGSNPTPKVGLYKDVVKATIIY